MARIVKIEASIELWHNMIIQDSVHCFKCVKGLPEGAKLVHSYQDADSFRRGSVSFIYEHESFEDVGEGRSPPFFDPEFEEVEHDSDKA